MSHEERERSRPRFRPATASDVEPIAALITRSARALSSDDYSKDQIEAALEGAWGLDSQLIADGTYFVAEADGRLVACGGWSFRATLFGADSGPDREPRRLDPAREAARVRAFFVDPGWARRGLGRRLLSLCEEAARAAGFGAAELVATLPGERLYAACGYVSQGARPYPLPHGLTIAFVPMVKRPLV